jgi:hypothetical protein
MDTTAPMSPHSSMMSDDDAALFQSLLSKSRPVSAATAASNSDVDPMAAMFNMQNMFGGGGGDSSSSSALSGANLAQSVLSSVSKRLDDDATQEMICGYLRGVEDTQLTQLAGMAGIPLNPDLATKMAKMCQNTTKKSIRKIVKMGRRIFYVGRLIRKAMKVMRKYKNVLIITSILWWTSSALTRPFPVQVVKSAASSAPARSSKVKAKAKTQVATAAASTTTATSSTTAASTTTAPTTTATATTVGTTPVGLLKPRR